MQVRSLLRSRGWLISLLVQPRVTVYDCGNSPDAGPTILQNWITDPTPDHQKRKQQHYRTDPLLTELPAMAGTSAMVPEISHVFFSRIGPASTSTRVHPLELISG